MGPLIGLTDPRVTDALGWGTDKVDFIWYDQEHGPMSPEALQSHIIAAHGRGIAVIVRVDSSQRPLKLLGVLQHARGENRLPVHLKPCTTEIYIHI